MRKRQTNSKGKKSLVESPKLFPLRLVEGQEKIDVGRRDVLVYFQNMYSSHYRMRSFSREPFFLSKLPR